jgi:hypothetical protein
VFGPLKTSYREQVERLFRGGADAIAKQHFTLLYSHARDAAMTPRNMDKTTSRKAQKQKDSAKPVAERVKKPPYQVELEVAERQIAASGYSDYCSVLCFA